MTRSFDIAINSTLTISINQRPHVQTSVNSQPILYSFRRCPYAMRARLAIAYSACHVELREVVLKDKPQCLLEYSPKATVPVLVLTQNGKQQVIDESLDIILWAILQNDAQHYLRNIDSDMPLILENDLVFKPQLDRYKYPNRFEDTDELMARAQACEFIQKLENSLQTQSHLGGAQASLADIAIFPFVRQFAYVDILWFQNSQYQQVNSWLSEHLASPLFKSIMKKYTPWQSGI